jgi:hypothetical protein
MTVDDKPAAAGEITPAVANEEEQLKRIRNRVVGRRAFLRQAWLATAVTVPAAAIATSAANAKAASRHAETRGTQDRHSGHRITIAAKDAARGSRPSKCRLARRPRRTRSRRGRDRPGSLEPHAASPAASPARSGCLPAQARGRREVDPSRAPSPRVIPPGCSPDTPRAGARNERDALLHGQRRAANRSRRGPSVLLSEATAGAVAVSTTCCRPGR